MSSIRIWAHDARPTPMHSRSRVAAHELVACARQSATKGATTLDRIQGAGAIAFNGEPLCRLLFQLTGQSDLKVGRPRVRLTPGRWALAIGSSGTTEVERGGEVLALSFPTAHLSRALTSQMSSSPGAVRPIAGAAQMCVELIRSCLAQTTSFNASVDDALGEALIELAKLALIEQFCTRRAETMRETARARIQAYIHRNIADPDLTIARIAERMQCTKRYLHKIFSEGDETLSQYIWSQRLELFRERLARSELSDRSITEIAFGCGFSNAAHFSRSFRARFGEPPRAFRRTVLARYSAERSRIP